MAKEEKEKKKTELEKMGDLDKGIKEKEESTEDVIKEIESFDATKNPPEGGEAAPAEAKSSEAAGKEKPKAEKKPSEGPKESKGAKNFESLKKELEREKGKTKNLAKIIEKFSSASSEPEVKVVEKEAKAAGPDLKDIEGKINEQVQSQLKEVKDVVAAIGSKVEEVAKAPKGERTSSKMKDIVDKMQADTSKKIAEIEETMKAMIEKTQAPKKEEEVSKGLASIGGSVDLKNKILEIRSQMKDYEKGLNELRDEMDTRLTRVKEQIKVLEKIPGIEGKLDNLIEKMGPENIDKLKKFVFSADEVTSEIIPNEIEKRMTKDLTPVFNDMKDVRDDIEKVNENIKTIFNEINFFRGEIKTLYKFGDNISELQSEINKVHKNVGEKESSLISMINKLEETLKQKTAIIEDRVTDFEKNFTEKLEEMVKDNFDNLTESRFLELEDRTEKNLATSRAKVNDMVSKFVQFQNVVNPTISLIKEELEKLNAKIEKLKGDQMELEEETEESVKEMFANIAEPKIKEIMTEAGKFSESVNDRLDDFQAEFVQFQNVINPTLNLLKNDLSKIDSKIEKAKAAQEDLKAKLKDHEGFGKSIESIIEGMKVFEGNQKDMDKRILVLGDKVNEIVEQINGIVKDTVAHQKKLENTSKKERERINILLKELKGS